MCEKFTVGDEILKKEKKCCICESKDNLEPHHIIPVNKYDEFYNSLDNVVVMCHNCHHDYHQKNIGEINFKTLLRYKGKYEDCNKLKKRYKVLKDAYKNLAKIKGVEIE